MPAIRVLINGFMYHIWSGTCRGIWFVLTGCEYGFRKKIDKQFYNSELMRIIKYFREPVFCSRSSSREERAATKCQRSWSTMQSWSKTARHRTIFCPKWRNSTKSTHRILQTGRIWPSRRPPSSRRDLSMFCTIVHCNSQLSNYFIFHLST